MFGVAFRSGSYIRSNIRPDGLSFPTRESRFVGDAVRAMVRVFLSVAPPPALFSFPPQAIKKPRRTKAKNERVRMAAPRDSSFVLRDPRTTDHGQRATNSVQV